MGSNNSVCVGIDDVAIHFPRLYMDMKDFADLRGEDYGKLNKGLGLKAMSIPKKTPVVTRRYRRYGPTKDR